MSAPNLSPAHRLAHAPAQARLHAIAQARHQLLIERKRPAQALVAGWVERSWDRCLSRGLRPDQAAVFELISREHMARTLEANRALVQTAQPILQNLGHAIADTHYFAILTNAQGVVVDVSGAIDRADRRAELITRIGTDLSEQHVGTTAICTALAEHQPVWLHRGEHFYANTADYSCAGAPVFGPQGDCVGMLDVTGIDAVERPELKHLVTQVAGKIENALVLAQPHALLVRLNWPGNAMGSDADGLLCLDGDGWITGANPAARQMVPNLGGVQAVHVGEVFGIPYHMLFDAVRRSSSMLEVPLWNGLRLQAKALSPSQEALPARGGGLKDIEAALIHQAVAQAKGNVAQAAEALGISRATVYRKLGRKPGRKATY